MEYLDLIEKFWQLTDEVPLNSSVVSTYFLLLDNWNKSGKTDFEYPDKLIQKKIKIDRKTIKINKETLRNLGLISYQVTMGFPTVYKIIPDYIIRNRKNKEVAATPIIAEKEKTPIPVVPKARKAPEIPKMDLPPVAVPTVAPVVPEQVPKAPEMPKTTENTKKDTPTTKDIPTFDEVLNFFKTLHNYEPSLEGHLKTKYEYWVNNGWVSGYNRPITNWQQTVKNTIPYLRSDNKNIFNIPNIKRPKATYDE